MNETLAHGYPSKNNRRELSNAYQHDRVKMVFKNLCVRVLWTKVASALEGLNNPSQHLFDDNSIEHIIVVKVLQHVRTTIAEW